MDGYATHLEALITESLHALSNHGGGIVELGCGWYSTPQLGALARHFGVDYHIYSTDPLWGKNFDKEYDVRYLKNWKDFKLEQDYAIALQDNELLTRMRIKQIPYLLKYCDVVLMHDVNKVMDLLPRPTDKLYKVHKPWTGVWYKENNNE